MLTGSAQDGTWAVGGLSDISNVLGDIGRMAPDVISPARPLRRPGFAYLEIKG